ncbi:type IV secretion protein Rhs, partial [Buttiauxella izardii]
MDIRLQIRSSELILNDNGGRSIHFDVLAPGAIAYSQSEKLWLARGGVDKQPDNHRLSRLWQALPSEVRLSPHTYFVANDATGPWWILEAFQLPVSPDDVLPRPLPPFRVLSGLVDRFGNQLRYHRDADGEFAGQVTAVTDSSGRRFRLELVTLPAGIRLAAVWLVRDVAFPDLPSLPLARYDYSPRCELAAVYDRAGVKTRHFEWHPQHAGLMVAHQYTGRPATRYAYDDSLRVISQSNTGGLSYQFVYTDQKTVVTDSLERTTVYHFAGERGLKRVVRLEQPDGSDIHSEFDGSGRLVSQTDAAGRKTEFQLDVVSGNLLALWHPDGSVSRYDYNARNQLTSATAPDGSRTGREYDEYGRLTAQTDALRHTRRYHYADENSAQPSETEDEAGGRQTLEWNEHGLLASYTDCSGYKTQYRYNRDGQPLEVTHEEGLSVQYEYDARGRLTSSEDNTGGRTSRQYNEAGDLLTTTHPDGSTTTQRYDARGNPLSQTSGGLIRQAEFDTAGRITGLINENVARTQFSYDVMDRLTAETGFDGREHRYQYSKAGELTHSEDAGLVTRWHYDENGKLIRRERPPLPDGTPDEMLFDHDEAGRLSEIAHRSENHLVCV